MTVESNNDNIVRTATSKIWSITEELTRILKPCDYGKVILPFTAIMCFDLILQDTKDKVLAVYKKSKNFDSLDDVMFRITKIKFYNVSKFTLIELTKDKDNIKKNFGDYLTGFSENIKEILDKLKIDSYINIMADRDILYSVIEKFADCCEYLSSYKNTDLEMSDLFEEIVRQSFETGNKDATSHYTPRDLAKLMVSILFSDKNNNDYLSNNCISNIYDPACGTGGLFYEIEKTIKEQNINSEIIPCGQEIDNYVYTICKADVLIKNNGMYKIKCGNTLLEDNFENIKFDYIISDPPFGMNWSKERKIILSSNKEEETDTDKEEDIEERYSHGLPNVGDSQMLFLLTALSKMQATKDGGTRIAMIQTGSSLFTGRAGSGPSEIRRYILENDFLEAIIALPQCVIYNTNTKIYLWILSNKKKDTKREGQVQLINASDMYEKNIRSESTKYAFIPDNKIEEITKIYGDFKENEKSKIYENKEFGYTKITVERPKKDESGNAILKKGKPIPDPKLRDYENVPLTKDIDKYFECEVSPLEPDAWSDREKDQIGYEIPFMKYFQTYSSQRDPKVIFSEIERKQDELVDNFQALKKGLPNGFKKS